MKKTFGLLVLLFVIVLASPLGPARADDFTNGDIVTVTPSISEQDLETYNNALQVLEYLRQGGTIDFSNVSDNYTSGDLLDEFVDLIDTVGSGIDYYGNNFLNNIFDLSTDTVQLSPNTKLKDRIGQFRSNLPSYLNGQDNNIPTPNPDPDYNLYIDRINGSGFWWKEWPNKNYYNANQLGMISSAYPPSTVSWISNYNDYSYNFTPTATRTQYCFVCGIQNLYIYSVNDVFYINHTISNSIPGFLYNNNPGYNGEVYKTQRFSLNTVGTNPDGTIMSTSGTLQEVLNWASYRFRNVNIYVNGVPWSIVGQDTSYNIGLGTGTYLIETNQPIEYKFEVPVYVDISDLIDKIQLAIDNKITLDFPYLNDLIVDTNGQMTLAVTVFQEDYTIDDLYVKDYGAMIPVFPLFVDYPVSLQQINNVATVGIIDVVPDEILQIFGMFLIGGLFVLLCHRLME